MLPRGSVELAVGFRKRQEPFTVPNLTSGTSSTCPSATVCVSPNVNLPEDDVGNERNQAACLGQCVDSWSVFRCGMITAIRIVGEGFGGSLGGVLADSEHSACLLFSMLFNLCSVRLSALRIPW